MLLSRVTSQEIYFTRLTVHQWQVYLIATTWQPPRNTLIASYVLRAGLVRQSKSCGAADGSAIGQSHPESSAQEHEGLYSVRLRTWDGTVEHSAYIYVKGQKLLL